MIYLALYRKCRGRKKEGRKSKQRGRRVRYSTISTTLQFRRPSQIPGMHVFVTVGSTKFDDLVNAVLSSPVQNTLRVKGYSSLVVQCGNSSFDSAPFKVTGDVWYRQSPVDTQVWRFKHDLQDEYERADLVISHAGRL